MNVLMFKQLRQGENVAAETYPSVQINHGISAKLYDPAEQQTPDSHIGEHLAIAELRTWLKQGRYAELQATLHKYLRESPENLLLLLIEAELIYHTRSLSYALSHYYEGYVPVNCCYTVYMNS
jgi:hypothetical protein